MSAKAVRYGYRRTHPTRLLYLANQSLFSTSSIATFLTYFELNGSISNDLTFLTPFGGENLKVLLEIVG
jgi:hypothetical protein